MGQSEFTIVEESARGDADVPEHSEGIRLGMDLLKATAPFAHESVPLSWWYVVSTLVLTLAALTAAAVVPWWPCRYLLSVLGALLIVRSFILYHDFLHGAILRGSKAAWLLFEIYGALGLAPPRSWSKSHNYHHGHVGQIAGSRTGAFPIMTTEMWKAAGPAERLRYRIERHPVTILFGYLTIFAFSICLQPLLVDPRRHLDSLVSIIAHCGLIASLWLSFGFAVAWFSLLLPMFIASALGGYLFFAQHSYKRMIVLSPEAWTFYRAALESSSYMKLNMVMQWFTGNIGYHHIHHLNVRIPFYRLPETMAAIPELQSPATTTLSPREVLACFRASLWDEGLQRMVSYREAGAL